jgi:hypothetical protein
MREVVLGAFGDMPLACNPNNDQQQSEKNITQNKNVHK